MIINTKHLGQLEISEENIINFPKGLPGFEDRRDFALIAIEDTGGFYLLQDLEKTYISFIMVNPWNFYKDYSIDIKEEYLKTIEAESNDSDIIRVYVIITLEDSLKSSTCNLMAPIIINTEKRKGRQIILNESPYRTKHRLFLEESKDANIK